MKIYLAGPINGCTDAQAKDWRAEVRKLHPDVIDPMDRDYRGQELLNDNVRNIVEGDKKDIDSADALLVYFERPSVGTSMEVLYAWEHGKSVVVVNASGKPLSPWLIYHSTAIATTINEALGRL
jgi:nucleoside 2-deoxyribosyltransferase